jgi:pimeloyl-ACP methyl ester carboxylesterase
MVSHLWGNQGPPLVLLHGNYGSWTHWLKNVEVLSRHFKVLAVDVPGYGDSAMPPAPYSFESIGEIIAGGVREIFGDERLSIVGFSMGSGMAAQVARLLESQTDSFVVVSGSRRMTGVTRGPRVPLIKWRKLPTPAEEDAAHRHNLQAAMIAEASRIDDLAVALQRSNARRTRIPAEVARGESPLQDIVPQLKCPVGFIWGEKDSAIGPYMEQRLAWIRQFRPDARYAVVPDAGHWVAYEQAESFNAALLGMLPASPALQQGAK